MTDYCIIATPDSIVNWLMTDSAVIRSIVLWLNNFKLPTSIINYALVLEKWHGYIQELCSHELIGTIHCRLRGIVVPSMSLVDVLNCMHLVDVILQ